MSTRRDSRVRTIAIAARDRRGVPYRLGVALLEEVTAFLAARGADGNDEVHEPQQGRREKPAAEIGMALLRLLLAPPTTSASSALTTPTLATVAVAVVVAVHDSRAGGDDLAGDPREESQRRPSSSSSSSPSLVVVVVVVSASRSESMLVLAEG